MDGQGSPPKKKMSECASPISGLTQHCMNQGRDFIFYAAGGARGAVRDRTWIVTGAASSGKGSEATGSSLETIGVISGSAGAWCARWQYGHRVSSAAL